MPPEVAVARPDRRSTRRAPSKVKMQARLSRATEEGMWMASIRNISAEGIGLMINRPASAGMFLTVEIPAPPPLIRKPMLLRVTHAKPQPDSEWWNLGGAFVRKLSRDELEHLKARSPAIVPNDERRTSTRHTTRLRSACPLVRVTEEGPWWSTIRNITFKGIGLICNRPFKPGMYLTVELPTQDAKMGKGRLLKITHSRPQPGGQWWVFGGIFLTKLTAEEVASLL